MLKKKKASRTFENELRCLLARRLLFPAHLQTTRVKSAPTHENTEWSKTPQGSFKESI